MRTVISFIISFLITIFTLNSCCEKPTNSYGAPKKESFVEKVNKAIEEAEKIEGASISKMGRFKLYDILPDSTKIYRSAMFYVIISPTGNVAVI